MCIGSQKGKLEENSKNKAKSFKLLYLRYSFENPLASSTEATNMHLEFNTKQSSENNRCRTNFIFEKEKTITSKTYQIYTI